MNPRLLRILLDAYSNETHTNSPVEVLVQVSGATDDTMRDSMAEAERTTGLNLNSLTEHKLQIEDLEKLLENGFDTSWPKSDIGMRTPKIEVAPSDSFENTSHLSLVSIVMFYSGFGNNDFTWEIVSPPILAGSANSILGYDLNNERVTNDNV